MPIIFLNLFFYALDLFGLAALLLVPGIWLFDPLEIYLGPVHFTCHWGWKPVLAALLLPALSLGLRQLIRARLSIAARGLWDRACFRKLALGFAALIIFFAAFEALLAALDFNYELPAIIFEGKNEFGGLEITHTIPDTELLYRLKPGDYFQGRQVNALGFREREVDPRKKAGTLRVICLGDSTTAQGLPGYSQYLHELLQADPPTGRPWEAFNMGVHGYSVRQGLILFRRQARELKPDIVTVYFGWNEHWYEAQSDDLLLAVRVQPMLGRIFDRLRAKRIFMALHWLINPLQRQSRGADDRVLRVPPGRYAQLLKQLVAEIRAAGAVPVIITAPRGKLSEHEVGQQRARSVADAERLHDQYVEITRQVARQTGAPLFDLAGIFSGPECARYFAADGIHFDQYAAEGLISQILPLERQPGLRQIAVELHKFLKQLVAGPAWRARRD